MRGVEKLVGNLHEIVVHHALQNHRGVRALNGIAMRKVMAGQSNGGSIGHIVSGLQPGLKQLWPNLGNL